MWNYVLATICAAVWLATSDGIDKSCIPAAGLGLLAGALYFCGLMVSVRNMRQRGLALTCAIASIAQVAPCLLAVGMGERMTWIQAAGIVLALACMPLLSLATASGKAIHDRPHIGFALLLLAIGSGAMTCHLLGGKFFGGASYAAYMFGLFSAAALLSGGTWLWTGRSADRGSFGLGLFLGAANFAGATTMLIAAGRVSGALFFVGMGVGALVLTTAMGVWWWRERLRRWGWFALVMAVICVVMINSGQDPSALQSGQGDALNEVTLDEEEQHNDGQRHDE